MTFEEIVLTLIVYSLITLRASVYSYETRKKT